MTVHHMCTTTLPRFIMMTSSRCLRPNTLVTHGVTYRCGDHPPPFLSPLPSFLFPYLPPLIPKRIPSLSPSLSHPPSLTLPPSHTFACCHFLQDSIFTAFKELFTSACSAEPPAGIAHSVQVSKPCSKVPPSFCYKTVKLRDEATVCRRCLLILCLCSREQSMLWI